MRQRVRFTPESGHPEAQERSRLKKRSSDVRLTPKSGRKWVWRWTSASDPKATFATETKPRPRVGKGLHRKLFWACMPFHVNGDENYLLLHSRKFLAGVGVNSFHRCLPKSSVEPPFADTFLSLILPKDLSVEHPSASDRYTTSLEERQMSTSGYKQTF